MNKAYKFRIYPNKEQKIFFAKTFGCTRFIYNKMLADKIEHYTQTGESLWCYPSQYKSEFEWLKEVDSLALSNAQMNLQKAYRNFFNHPKTGFPKFKSKKISRQSYTTNCINGSIKLMNGYIKLPKAGLVKIKQHREIPEDYVLKSVTISKTPSNKYFASILFEYTADEIQAAEIKNIVAVHYTNRYAYLDSSGTIADYPHYYIAALEKLKREQRRLSKMKNGSSNKEKQRIKLARIHEKISNQRKDFWHKRSAEYANLYDAVVTDGFDLSKIAGELWLGKTTNDNSYGMFKTMLRYKLEALGKKCIEAPAELPISKTCSCCGKLNQDVTLQMKDWHCSCGAFHDREVNAVNNLLSYGLHELCV